MAEVRVLRVGEAVSISDVGVDPMSDLTVTLTSSAGTPDMVALLVTPAGKVRNDDDLVFYNNPSTADQSIAWSGVEGGVQQLRVLTATIDPDIDRIVVGAAGGLLDSPTSCELTLTVGAAGGGPVASAQVVAEPDLQAMILLEVYRRAGSWRMRLLAQGYARGLAALVTAFGVDVDQSEEPSAPTSSAPAISPAGTAPSSPVPVQPTDDQDVSVPFVPPPTPTYPQHPSPQQTPPPYTYPAPYTPPTQVPPNVGQSVPGGPPSPPPWPAPPPRRGMFTSRRRAQLEAENAEMHRLLAVTGAMDNVTLDADRQRLIAEVAQLTKQAASKREELFGLEARLQQIREEIAVAEGDMELTEVGIYRYRHRLDDAIAYKARLDQLRDRIKSTAKLGGAVTGATDWSVNNSYARGRRMVNEVSKLMLRAYNADVDHAVRTLRPYKLESALARLDTTRSTIARLGTTMSIAVTDEYHRLRRQELELTADYLNKVEEEKERQRQLREQQREQARADAEYAREQQLLERDRDKYADALARLEAGKGDSQQIAQIRSQLTSVNAALADVAYRRSNMRLGYVYVISNVGAFGERMVKIGMTRRQQPEDRVRELGDASVPFRFDTHALIFSEDAVALETALHQRFADRAVNRVNRHREFFYVTPAEVRQALSELGTDILVEYNEETPAPEWRESGGPDRAVLPT